MGNEGGPHAQRSSAQSSYLPNTGFNLNNDGGGTYTHANLQPSVQDYENVFGPSARDIKEDMQRYKRHGRWHLPDALRGPNPWLADRIDGLITDAATSPFTSTILPYKYFDNVDGKLKWNVWSFDEAMASRVPYEAAARTLTQTKRSFAGYAVRHGLAITMEHNFMMTPKGRENFQNQLNQLVGSIQYTNDLDVHMALILAPSHEKHMLEKYNNYGKSALQCCREYVELFGFMQKNQNALDILIEEAKQKLKNWGGPMPNFILTNSKLTFQLTMTPERTNYISQGPDGVRRLKQGPDLQSYRGLSIIPSRSFSTETGQPPRDMLRRRVRVAEYYRIRPDANNNKHSFELYNEQLDTFFNITWKELFKYALVRVRDNDDFDNTMHPAVVPVLQSAMKNSAHGQNMLDSQFIDAPHTDKVKHPHAEQNFEEYMKVIQRYMELNLGMYQVNEPAKIRDYILEAEQNVQYYINIYQDAKDNGQTIPFNVHSEVQKCWETLKQIQQNDPEYKMLPEKLQGRLTRLITMYHDLIYEFGDLAQKVLPSYHNLEKVAKSTEEYKAWQSLLKEVHNNYIAKKADSFTTALAGNQVVLPVDKIVASFVSEDAVFVPFLQNLHFTKDVQNAAKLKDFFSSNSNIESQDKLSHIPVHVHEGVNHGLARYPRKHQVMQYVAELIHPFSHETCTSGSSKYNEAKIALTRLFRRYAAPTSYICKTINDRNQEVLSLNPQILDSQDIFVDSLFYQPLGAFNEPNHPLFAESMAASSAKDLHKSWIITKEIIDLLYDNPERMQLASSIAANEFSLHSQDISKAKFSHMLNTKIISCLSHQGHNPVHGTSSRLCCYTWNVADTYLSNNDYLNPNNPLYKKYHLSLAKYAPEGIVTNEYLHQLHTNSFSSTDNIHHPWLQSIATMTHTISTTPSTQEIQNVLYKRLQEDAYAPYIQRLYDSVGGMSLTRELLQSTSNSLECSKHAAHNFGSILAYTDTSKSAKPTLEGKTEWRRGGKRFHVFDPANEKRDPFEIPLSEYDHDAVRPENWEFVIIRPNIEHYMLGIIMGLSGENLGNTLWGQTELSVYDDSQHGVWGMSYKYHERAIVFNEKNLIRLWDIAYDGYNGGKDDTYVNWTDEKSVSDFKEHTNDVTQDYHGASMMVMAFYRGGGISKNETFIKKYKSNWPSPIVYYNEPSMNDSQNFSVVTGAENQMQIQTHELRVFNRSCYPEYQYYFGKMPNFRDLNQMRKSANDSTVEDETQIDVLAFQGTIITKKDGMTISTINGSGHHGHDYIGVASVRAGKGYKMMGGISNLVRQI